MFNFPVVNCIYTELICVFSFFQDTLEAVASEKVEKGSGLISAISLTHIKDSTG